MGILAGIDKPGLVRKSQDGWTSYFSAAPIIAAEVIRKIAKDTGCHIYDDAGDVVVANASFLSIYSPAGGDRTIRLPKAMSVVDLLKGKTVAENVSEFPLKLAANESVLFKIEPSAVAASSSAIDNEKLFRSYRAQHDAEPTADPNSEFWKGISGVTFDKSVLGPEVPELKAEVRSRWTDKFIYFLFSGHYESLTLNAHPDTQHETPHLWEKDVFEVYLGSDTEHPNRYREFQLSPQGEFLDNDIDSTVRRPGYNGEEAWNSGMSVKSRIDEKQKIWYGELKIPFAALMLTRRRSATNFASISSGKILSAIPTPAAIRACSSPGNRRAFGTRTIRRNLVRCGCANPSNRFLRDYSTIFTSSILSGGLSDCSSAGCP